MNDSSVAAGLHFPSSFPKGCPPDEVPFADCEVFRVVKSDPPAPDEFPTWAEVGKILDGRECECHGVSVFLDKEDAEFYAEKYPHLGEMIAKGYLTPSHGKLAHTPRIVRGVQNSHCTWWPFVGVVRHAFFTIASGD